MLFHIMYSCFLPDPDNKLDNTLLIRVLVESQFYFDISGALIFFL